VFKRILKSITALGAGHGVQTLTHLLLPPAFIAAYGVHGYGEWLTLSAAVGYLSTLDFGLQTYVLNELTALYHQRKMEQFHQVQSVGLILTLAFVGSGILLAGSVFLFPITKLIGVSGSELQISLTVFCLALQVIAGIPLGQIFGIYRTFGQAHRGAMWGNAYRLVLLGMTLSLALLRVPFWLLALGQVVSILTMLSAVLVCLKLYHPEVCPRVTYWDWKLARQILKPSSFFIFFILNQFVLFQAPVLILNRFAGPGAVVAFTVCRTLFSFIRQANSLLQAAIAPEVTRLNGLGDKDKLVRVYLFSESAVLASALVINVGLLLMSPVILRLWLNRVELFDWPMFLLMMVVSILMSVKDYKLYFQYATNRHTHTALVTFISYACMLAISLPLIQRFSVAGFLAVWALCELVQIAFLHFFNTQLLQGTEKLSAEPAIRLLIALCGVLLLLVPARVFLQSQHFLWRTITALVVMALLSGISYFLFGLKHLFAEGRMQLMKIRVG
jgi:O-antigen/teichoic acid export membrane protein